MSKTDTHAPVAAVEPMPTISSLNKRIAEHRETVSRRRAEWFCPGPDFVLGIPCDPITPRSYTMLQATESEFVLGGTPLEGSIRNYVWFHSPHFVTADHPDVAKRRRLALAPFERQVLGPRWARLFLRRFKARRYTAILAMAIDDIAAIVRSTFIDVPSSSKDSGPSSGCLESQLIYLFARELGWVPERTSNTPLRRLFQLIAVMTAAKGEYQDPSEAEMIAEYLRKRNADKLNQPIPTHG